MDCKKLQHKIDELYSEKGIKLDLQEQKHVNDCAECGVYYTEASEAHQLLKKIQQWEPVLDNPQELTESIMMSISQEEQNSLNDQHNRFKILVRFLTAAVVALLLTLGIEQYTVLNKVQLLEAKMGKVQQSYLQEKYLINKAALIDINILSKDRSHDFTLKKVSNALFLYRIKRSDFTLSDLNRYMYTDDLLKSSQNNTSQ